MRQWIPHWDLLQLNHSYLNLSWRRIVGRESYATKNSLWKVGASKLSLDWFWVEVEEGMEE